MITGKKITVFTNFRKISEIQQQNTKEETVFNGFHSYLFTKSSFQIELNIDYIKMIFFFFARKFKFSII